MNRRDFYFRQRVTEAELDDTFDQVENADKDVVADLLGAGLMGTPTATQHTPQDLTIDLSALLGYDNDGRRVEIPSASAPRNVNCAVDEVGASTAVVGALNEKWLAIFIQFDRALSDLRTDGNGTPVYWQRDETFKVNVVQSAEAPIGTAVKPPPRPGPSPEAQLLLCDVHLISGQTQILNADISHLRRENFILKLIHGPTHTELGSDPVPLASLSDGGIIRLCADGVATAGRAVQGNDLRLLPEHALAAIRKLASRPSLVFYPDDASADDKYVLHQYHGMARGDYQNPGNAYGDFYFEYDKAHADYPLKVYFAPHPRVDATPGRGDNTRPLSGTPDAWFYVYLIGRDSAPGGFPTLALVCSTQPPWTGPTLTDGAAPLFNFWNGGVLNGLEGRWRYWKFIGAVVDNGVSGSSWELVPLRKKGNHVEYELGQYLFQSGVGTGGFVPLSCSVRLPPTSMRGFFYIRAGQDNPGGGGSFTILKIRPPAGGTMGLNDIPLAGRSKDCKIHTEHFAPLTGAILYSHASGWCETNTARDIDYQLTSGGPNQNYGEISLLGYEEFDDVENGGFTW